MCTMHRPLKINIHLHRTGIFRFHLLVIMALLLILPSAANGAQAPFAQKTGGKYWIPNTTIKLTPYASAATATDETLYFALTGGLGEYNFRNRTFSVYFVSDDEIEGDITSLALQNTILWVATRNGVMLFNTEKKSFTRTLNTHNSPLGADNNITLVQSPGSQDIYIMSFEHLQKYDGKNGKWEDLTHLYKDFALGEPASNPFCIAGENDIWIAASAHESCRGGLFRYAKKEKKWTVYRDELSGKKNVKRVDIDDMLLSSKALYVLTDDRIGRFDLAQNKWETYPTDNLQSLKSEIPASFPGLKGHYSSDTNCILGYFSRIGDITLKDYREVYFTSREVLGLNPESFTIFNSRETETPVRYTQNPLCFQKALGYDGKSKALFLTNRGLEIFDGLSKDLRTIKKSGYFIDRSEFYEYSTTWKENLIFLLLTKMPEPEETTASQSAQIFLMDQKKNNLQEITPRGVRWIEEIFLYKNRIYCTTDKSIMSWKNGSWTPVKEKVIHTPPTLPPPSRTQVYTLKDGKKLEFNPRGVFVY